MLTVHRSEAADTLLRALGDVLDDRPADPLVPDVVVVPSRGIERWIAQELSLRTGVTANVRFPSPWSLFRDTWTAADVDGSDPWESPRLEAAIQTVLERQITDPVMAVPRHATVDGDGSPIPGRLTGVATRTARLFGRYLLDAPHMIQRWSRGEDVDPVGGALRPVHQWQSTLFRLVREAIGTPSAAEDLEAVLARIEADPDLLELPDRVCFYGFTALPVLHARTLRAVAEARDIHLFALHPSEPLWTADSSQPLAAGRPRSAGDDSDGNRLLRSWGRDARELQAVVNALDPDAVPHHPVLSEDRPTVLAELQSRLRDDQPDGRTLPPDSSVQIHSCHGPSRQVEVARDAILHALCDDPTLEPRDVIVMCPDVERYAPLVEAAFHADAASGGIPDLRVRVADRAPVRSNPLMHLVLRLVALGRSRVSVTEVSELLDLPAVRRRFRLDDETCTNIITLAHDLGVRWGLDADHRVEHDLGEITEHTWSHALDRAALGAFLADREYEPVAGEAPFGLDHGALDHVSTLSEIVHRLDWAMRQMRDTKPAAEWLETLTMAADALGDVEWGHEWQRDGLRRDLERSIGTSEVRLGMADLAELLAPLGATRPSTLNHRTGDLTVCTLVPMRSVPHRVIVLMGMDDERFPRSPVRDGDDLLSLHPVVGSRDVASEDRQLLLDAVLATGDRLIVTYSGRDERSNAPLPPAVPVAELLEELESITGARFPVVEHPLQPFDARVFTAGALIDGVWGFDLHMHAGAVATTAPESVDHTRPTPSPLEREDDLRLEDLIRFFDHPVRAYLSERVGVRFFDLEEPVDEHLPIESTGLDTWFVGDSVLGAGLRGVDRSDVERALRSAGRLPVGRLADAVLADVGDRVDEILAVAREAGATLTPGRPVPIDVALRDGRRLIGAVPDVVGDRIEWVSYSTLRPKQELRAWIGLLALTLTEPDRPWSALLAGRDRRNVKVKGLTSPASHRGDWALERLGALVDLLDRGLEAPIPLFAETSPLIAEGVKEYLIRGAWSNDWYSPEASDRHHREVFGGALTYEELLAIPPEPDEASWHPSDSRVTVLAHRLWDPVIEARFEP